MAKGGKRSNQLGRPRAKVRRKPFGTRLSPENHDWLNKMKEHGVNKTLLINRGLELLREKMENEVAKATFVRTRGAWRVFWQRADLKWHRYDPAAQVPTIEEVLRIVDEDQYCCFFG